MAHNKLYYGDNLEVLRNCVPDETIDLCYIDPPFNSGRDYNQIYNTGGDDRAQAFVDTWTWDAHAVECFEQILRNENGVQTRQSIELTRGLEKVLGRGSLFAYLVMMTVRIAEIRRVLKTTGSFYLHCDPTASHYLKLVCDALIVGQGGFYRNEIAWKRNSGHSDAIGYGRIRDVILFYTKTKKATWNDIFQPYEEEYVDQYYRHKDACGRRWMSDNLSAAGLSGGGYEYEWNGCIKLWRCPKKTMQKLHDEGKLYYTRNGVARRKRYLDEAKGMPAQDLWTDVQALRSWHGEKLGYPTQKPEALLERIIAASSNEGDTVLDAFCGGGTSVAVAERMRRRWIGIDITYQSIALVVERLEDSFGKIVTKEIELGGVPHDMEAVRALVNRCDARVRKEFEKWAVLTYSNNRAVLDEEVSAGRGFDGVVYVAAGRVVEKRGVRHLPVMLSVKSGKVGAGVVRDLRRVIEREGAAGGVLLTLEEPTRPMLKEARRAGQFKGEFGAFDRLRIVTVQQILDGERMRLPSFAEVRKRAGLKPDAKQLGVYTKE